MKGEHVTLLMCLIVVWSAQIGEILDQRHSLDFVQSGTDKNSFIAQWQNPADTFKTVLTVVEYPTLLDVAFNDGVVYRELTFPGSEALFDPGLAVTEYEFILPDRNVDRYIGIILRSFSRINDPDLGPTDVLLVETIPDRDSVILIPAFEPVLDFVPVGIGLDSAGLNLDVNVLNSADILSFFDTQQPVFFLEAYFQDDLELSLSNFSGQFNLSVGMDGTYTVKVGYKINDSVVTVEEYLVALNSIDPRVGFPRFSSLGGFNSELVVVRPNETTTMEVTLFSTKDFFEATKFVTVPGSVFGSEPVVISDIELFGDQAGILFISFVDGSEVNARLRLGSTATDNTVWQTGIRLKDYSFGDQYITYRSPDFSLDQPFNGIWVYVLNLSGSLGEFYPSVNGIPRNDKVFRLEPNGTNLVHIVPVSTERCDDDGCQFIGESSGWIELVLPSLSDSEASIVRFLSRDSAELFYGAIEVVGSEIVLQEQEKR